MVDIGRIFHFQARSGDICSSGGSKRERKNIIAGNIYRNRHLHNSYYFKKMEIKLLIFCGKWLVIPVLLMDTIVSIWSYLAQITSPVPPWAQVDPVYRNIFMVIGILYLLVRLAIYIELLWSRHMDNLKKRKNMNK